LHNADVKNAESFFIYSVFSVTACCCKTGELFFILELSHDRRHVVSILTSSVNNQLERLVLWGKARLSTETYRPIIKVDYKPRKEPEETGGKLSSAHLGFSIHPKMKI
jgi:hypothetical protein